jgi:tRNA modification GTPase
MSPANRQILLTPPGVGAIAVLRLLGPGVEEFLAEHFSRPQTSLGRCIHGDLRDGATVLDDPVVVRGEGFVDLNLHGGSWIVHSVQELARRKGFVPTDDPLDGVDAPSLLEKEILAALPSAPTREAISALLAQRAAWQDVSADDLPAIAADASLWHLLHPPRVAIVGIPNVGKSTLANQLFGQERSITADLPGTTRDWVGEVANLDGLAVMLYDTPGMCHSDDSVELQAMEHGRGVVESAELVVVVLDPTQDHGSQLALRERYPSAVVVVNKTDLDSWPLPNALTIVATTGEGTDELRREIRRRFGCEPLQQHRARWWTMRQKETLAAKRWPFK